MKPRPTRLRFPVEDPDAALSVEVDRCRRLLVTDENLDGFALVGDPEWGVVELAGVLFVECHAQLIPAGSNWEHMVAVADAARAAAGQPPPPELACKVEWCEGWARTRGWCEMHYRQYLRDGHVNMTRPHDHGPGCDMRGCVNTHHARGLCSTHHRRLLAAERLAAEAVGV